MSDLTFLDLRIEPAGRGVEVLDFLIGDLRSMQQDIGHDGKVAVGKAQAIERNMLHLLDSISPEIHRATAKFERYRDAPKVGGE